MIIDFHAHLGYYPMYPGNFIAEMFTGIGEEDKNALKKILSFFLKDKTGESLIKQMNDAGIDKSVLLIIDGGMGLGEAPLTIEEIHELHHGILRTWPDRFVVFAGIDPRRGKKGIVLFEKAIYQYGFKGLKLYPPMGFSILDKDLVPYFEICKSNRIPVLIHTGNSLGILQNQFANPLEIANVCSLNPGVNFILAHAGYSLNGELIKLISTTPNLFVDIAGFQSLYHSITVEMVNTFSPLFSKGLNKKVLFGSDWPLFNLMVPLNKNIETIRKISELVSDKCNNALENIFYNNALDLLITN